MTGAELKTIRESLGLTARWCAENVGGLAHIRSWQRWESDVVPVPTDVADEISAMDSAMTTQAGNACRVALERADKHGPTDVVDLIRYASDAELWAAQPEMNGLPATFHAAMLARTRANLIEAGFKVSIEYAI